MPKKRRNGGRNRHGRGHTRLVDCSHCMCKPAKVSTAHDIPPVPTRALRRPRAPSRPLPRSTHLTIPPLAARTATPHPLHAPQDKAIGRFMVRNMVDAGGLNDLKAASAYEREFGRGVGACGRGAGEGVRVPPPQRAARGLAPHVHLPGCCRLCGLGSLHPRARNPAVAPLPLSPAVYVLPKLFSKNYYCVSCAVHSRIVRVRNVVVRRSREPPVRFRRSDAGKKA
jgi:ribosomal protein S26